MIIFIAVNCLYDSYNFYCRDATRINMYLHVFYNNFFITCNSSGIEYKNELISMRVKLYILDDTIINYEAVKCVL